MRPTFLVIGAMKCGTTSLHNYLSAHPQVFMSAQKELNFFSGQSWDRGWTWYEQQFAEASDEIAIGESSPDYTKADIYSDAAPRIAECLPDARLVYLVRDPVARMLSMYVHNRARGRETRPVEVALRENEHYLTTSRYRWQLDRYLAHVPRERILVVVSEDLRYNREQAMRRVLRFLGVDDNLLPLNLDAERHRSADKRRQRGLTRRLSRYGWYRQARGRAPRPLRDLARPVTTRAVQVPALGISSTLDAQLRERLRDDVAGLREFLDADWDGWGIA